LPVQHEGGGQITFAIAYIPNPKVPKGTNIRFCVISLVDVGVNAEGAQERIAADGNNSGMVFAAARGVGDSTCAQDKSGQTASGDQQRHPTA
jgi:hypothetical protein